MLFIGQLHVFMCLVPCCNICYNVRVKAMFGSSLLPLCQEFM